MNLDLAIQKQIKKSKRLLKKNFKNEVKKILNKRDKKDKRSVAILAQDEARFGRITETGKCWAPSKTRPIVGKQITREYIYAYTAVSPSLGKMTSLILPEINTEMMNIFLKEVSKDFKDYFVIMQVDGASWHKSKNLILPENIRLIEQPPYSPELNPVEHIWDDIREKDFANKTFKSLDAVMDCITKGLKRLWHNPTFLSSLTNFPHLNYIMEG